MIKGGVVMADQAKLLLHRKRLWVELAKKMAQKRTAPSVYVQKCLSVVVEPFCTPCISVQCLRKLSQALCCCLLDLSAHLVPSVALCSHRRNAVVHGLNLMPWLAVDQQWFLDWADAICLQVPSKTKEFWRTPGCAVWNQIEQNEVVWVAPPCDIRQYCIQTWSEK